MLESTSVGHLATINDDGSPQVNPVWFLWDGTHILLGVKADTIKYRNLRRDPRLALSIPDGNDQFRYLEVRGTVLEFELYLDLTFVNQLSQKYVGHDMDSREMGQERYKLTVRVDSWTGK
jgi:PPOX class probable F420-dependent enzyme